jgi:hypothetical protein
MNYKIFKEGQNFTDNEIDKSLREIVESSVNKVINECSKYEHSYVNRNENHFPGIQGMLPLLDDNLFKQEVLKSIQEVANIASVGRPLKVDAMDLIHGDPYDSKEVDVVKKNVNKMKDKIFEICDEVKEDALTKFNLLEMQRVTNDLAYKGHLVPRINACIKDHDYKILTAKEKVESKMKFATEKYPESDIRNFVKSIYIDDLKDQIKCADSMRYNNVNEYENAIHKEFKELTQYTINDGHGQERTYGSKLNALGADLLDMKTEFSKNTLKDVDANFEVFYAMVHKFVAPFIQDHKQTMLEKLKNAVVGNNVDIEADIRKNESLTIQDYKEMNSKKPSLKM